MGGWHGHKGAGVAEQQHLKKGGEERNRYKGMMMNFSAFREKCERALKLLGWVGGGGRVGCGKRGGRSGGVGRGGVSWCGWGGGGGEMGWGGVCVGAWSRAGSSGWGGKNSRAGLSQGWSGN